MKNITVIGIGKLGLCLGLNLANSGFNVLGVDINQNYINELNNKTFNSNEPDVNEFLHKTKNFKATTCLEDGLNFSDIIFLMVATPSLDNGKYDHSQIENVLQQIEKIKKPNRQKAFIIGCTTYPGYCESIKIRMLKLNYSIAYNPEFIAQGNIINGQRYPDLILIGTEDSFVVNCLTTIYSKICENEPKIKIMNLTEAELTKLAVNCFITTKISFANMIGDLCNNLKISHTNVLNAIGCDSRIGNKYLNWGFGFGGPCFPRDNKALAILCNENDILPEIPVASDSYNNLHKMYQSKFLFDNEVIDNSIKIHGITFKKGSSSIIESQQLGVALELVKLGVKVTIVDTGEVIEEVKKIYQDKFIYEKSANI